MRRKNQWRRDWSRNKHAYTMASVIVAYYLLFHYLPMAGVVTAFQNYRPALGFFGSKFVGLKNIQSFLNSIYAFRTIRNTLLINVYDILFGFPCPILLALLFNELRWKPFQKVVQTISYMPHFISLVVVCGILHAFTRTNGVINAIAGIFGKNYGNLLSQAGAFRTIYIGSGIWQGMGWGSIIYLATLTGVDPNLHEAAAIDGAGRFRRILHVTLPALVPVITIQLIMKMGHIMSQGHEKIILLYNSLTYETADVISSYVYRRGLEEMNYSLGVAVGLFNSLVNIVILFLANAFSRAVVQESLW